ncbi:hypothetical protein GPECTOR_15g491 [Gonium pectorale]|uniref:Uncharacterized protein n=1 Tax=Gonium pectorale TaxID=33097 RepID=A0A150GM30_GONPE|nr:hypothetical protein GPECTOR_15g491 [Gonium pectorale]|eukprot:KXZ50805.1 hypothetical protein GPECTOR_15g491 [Gonium pectorale]
MTALPGPPRAGLGRLYHLAATARQAGAEAIIMGGASFLGALQQLRGTCSASDSLVPSSFDTSGCPACRQGPCSCSPSHRLPVEAAAPQAQASAAPTAAITVPCGRRTLAARCLGAAPFAAPAPALAGWQALGSGGAAAASFSTMALQWAPGSGLLAARRLREEPVPFEDEYDDDEYEDGEFVDLDLEGEGEGDDWDLDLDEIEIVDDEEYGEGGEAEEWEDDEGDLDQPAPPPPPRGDWRTRQPFEELRRGAVLGVLL